MRKLFAFGALFLAIGVSSCKTYCPAYSYAPSQTPQTEQEAPQNVTASANTTEKVNG